MFTRRQIARVLLGSGATAAFPVAAQVQAANTPTSLGLDSEFNAHLLPPYVIQ